MLPYKLSLVDLVATQKLAERIASLLRKGDFIALKGDLGVGKTEFARALLLSLGIEGEVPSPTFTLLQIYETKNFLVSHFDLYRLKSEEELEELGWDDALSDGVTIVEWPEKAGSRLPQAKLALSFRFLPDGTRKVDIEKGGDWSERLSSFL